MLVLRKVVLEGIVNCAADQVSLCELTAGKPRATLVGSIAYTYAINGRGFGAHFLASLFPSFSSPFPDVSCFAGICTSLHGTSPFWI